MSGMKSKRPWTGLLILVSLPFIARADETMRDLILGALLFYAIVIHKPYIPPTMRR